jgi:hypothetical protein
MGDLIERTLDLLGGQLPGRRIPTSPLDPYSDEALASPWATYATLQDLGAAVWLTRYRCLLSRDMTA